MRCTATQKADGTPLKPHWAIKGGTVCNHHGGGAPQVRAAANARLTEEKARKALHIWATDPKAVESADHPGDVLLEELARTVSVVRRCIDRLPNAIHELGESERPIIRSRWQSEAVFDK